jgi:all-trans-retinol 13,14-reductase
VITAAGGKAFARAPVRRIITDDHHRAVGVAMADGSVIKAKHAVVSDAGVMNTIHSLVPDDEREALLQKFQLASPPQADSPSPSKTSLQNSMTGLTLFVGLKGDHDVDFHLPHDQLWLYPSAAIEEDLRSLPPTLQGAQDVAPQDLMMFIGSPSGKDSAWKTNHPQRTTLEIITAAPWEWFEAMAPHETSSSVEGATDLGGKPGSHGKEYAVVKQVLANKMWTRARQALTDQGATGLPEDLADVGTYCLGTPLTYAHFLQSRQGAFYGLNHDRERFAPQMFWENLRPEVPEMDHLYLTGQDIATCGLTGALMGAYLCASKILGVTNPFRLLDEVEHNRVVAGSASPSLAADSKVKAMPTTVGVAM